MTLKVSKSKFIIIDAGIVNIDLRIVNKSKIKNITIPNNNQIENLFEKYSVSKILKDKTYSLFITGKLAKIVRDTLCRGEIILPSATIWTEARHLMNEPENKNINSLSIIDLSASGYMVIAIDKQGKLIDDLLITNPRCGAGTGINLSRILQKLDIDKGAVDELLKDYLGEKGKEKRERVQIRADRCGVFSSSATISDKNQGIPLENALAVTMKSEALKVCKKLIEKTEKVYLTGRVFDWQFMRDCANDYLKSIGVSEVIFDKKQAIILNGVQHLVEKIGNKFRVREKLSKPPKFNQYPSFKSLKEKYEKSGIYKRLTNQEIHKVTGEQLEHIPVNIGLDVGSTMAKMVIVDAKNNTLIFESSYDNHGDTVETIKHIFNDIKKSGANYLNIQNIGITGSGRYQVQNVLRKVYPTLGTRIFTLVENYAHAHGSIEYAKKHISNLKQTIPDINQDFYVLVDIGGEDTKVSIVSLEKEELFDNVMNIKCSAGTGSLMDTLKALFGIDSISEACLSAFNADKAYEVNATCAVFLMENAKKMQASGFKKDEILASCNYAIVENMARTLWNQIEFPKNAVVLLHGQTMLSDPLPLAVTRRLQEDGNMFSLIPPLPGHRACIGLVNSIKDKNIIETKYNLDDFINVKFNKKIITCMGAACGDKNARCSRTFLSSADPNNKMNLLLGGCTAVNELVAGKKIDKNTIDAYKQIWNFTNDKLPRSNAKNRLIIPRSFAVSDQAYFLSQIFENLGIPVHVDNVQEKDILQALSLFDIDVCAPLIGAAGQFIRLASEDHGVILAPQIDFLPTGETSLGRTCTTNQGGVAIAEEFAKSKHPNSNFHLFDLSIKKLEPEYLAKQFDEKLKKVFQFYNLKITNELLVKVIKKAIKNTQKLKTEQAELVGDILEHAIKEKRNITVVCGREYTLNPGIYDSHVGKLLKDKGVVAIPSYAFDTELDPNFDYIYWKNPHDIISKINAIANKKLYKIIKNERLQKIIKKIETKSDGSISMVQVSTFRCGPDTVTTPTIAEITKKIPSLFIQSDAMIKELAHLENRVNTYINQLNKKLHQSLSGKNFEIKIVEEFDSKGLNKETDVVYFPTLHDNRTVTSVFRSAGVTVIDNFEDQEYNLEQKVRLGRKYAGDAVCAPLAAVFADMLLAVEDFTKRKKANDPLLKGKTRLLIFDNKGTGPCRQGQYFEMHKLLLNKKFGCNTGKGSNKLTNQVKLLVANEKDAFNVGLDEWAVIQSFQGLILKGVLHSMLLKFGANCKNYKQYKEFHKDHRELKEKLFQILEKETRPKESTLKLADKVSKKSIYAGAIIKYFGYGLHNSNGLRKEIKEFSNKWSAIQKEPKNRIKIYIEGEAYIRVALLEDVFNSLIDAIGFKSFEMDYSPLWCYMELLLELEILNTEENIKFENHLELKKQNKLISNLRLSVKIFRGIAKPLYDAGKVEMPEEMNKVLKNTQKILPTMKPRGELPAYLGEAILKADKGVDLFLNVAPEGCMVSSMGQLFSNSILQLSNHKTRIEDLFTLNGEVNHEQIQMVLLKTMGPEKYYKMG